MNKSISVVIPARNEYRGVLKKTASNLWMDPMVGEIIVVDDCSDVPVDINGVTIVRNKTQLGSAASRLCGISMAKYDVVLTTDSHVRFTTGGWGQIMLDALKSNPNGIVCPTCVPKGDCGFRKFAYGGHLDVLVPRGGGVVVLEPRWNTEPSSDGRVECVMGGGYAFNAAWHRKIGSYSGIKGCCPTELVALSLKTRLSGGSCVVLRDVLMEHLFSSEHNCKPASTTTAYNKMRLAFVALPPEVATAIPTLLTGTKGVEDALRLFVSDFQEIVAERDSFWKACGSNPESAAKVAGIELGMDFKIRKAE